jgi:hypothetical protein
MVEEEVEEELREREEVFVVDVSEIVNPILERLDALMEASQGLGAEVEAVIQAVRDAEGRVQAKVGELEAEIQNLTTTGSAEEAAAMEKLRALREEVAGIVPAAADAGSPPPADTPPADVPPPADAPPAPADGGDVPPADVPPPADAPPADPAPPSDVPPVDAPPADAPPADAPPADGPVDVPPDAGTPPTP